MQLAIRRLLSSLAVFIVACSLVATAQAAPTAWTVVQASGAVDIKDAAQKALGTQPGTQLNAPFGVLSGSNGHALISHGKDKLTIGPNSQVFIAKPEFTDTSIITRVKQMLGSVLYKVQHRVEDTFEVDTPYLVSVVKGTTFNIHVTSDDSTVALIEGLVWVHTPDMKYKLILKPGQAAVVSRHSKGIILKDQHAMSAPVEGPITVARDGGVVQTLMPVKDLNATTGSIDAVGTSNVSNSISMSNKLSTDSSAINTGNLLDVNSGALDTSASIGIDSGSLVDLNSGVAGVSTSAAIGGDSLVDVSTAVGDVSGSATIGSDSIANVGANVGNITTSATVGGTSLADVGTSVGNITGSATVGGGNLLDIGTSVGGVTTGIDLGTGTSGATLTTTAPATTTATTTSTTTTSTGSTLNLVPTLTNTLNLTTP